MINIKAEHISSFYIKNHYEKLSIENVIQNNMNDIMFKTTSNLINSLTSPGEGVTAFTSPYLSAGAPALGEAKGLIFGNNDEKINFPK